MDCPKCDKGLSAETTRVYSVTHGMYLTRQKFCSYCKGTGVLDLSKLEYPHNHQL